MALLTVEEFRLVFDPERITQLASDSSRQHGNITYHEGIVTAVITQAEGIIKNALSLQYTVLQMEADAGLKRMTADIAMYYLELRRPPVTPATERLYKIALGSLEQLQQGVAKLVAVDQLLPIGPTEEPTEATASGYFD